MPFFRRGYLGQARQWRALRALSAAAFTLTPASVFADAAEDFCKAMQDQFIACQEETAKGGSCYNAAIIVFNDSEKARKVAGPAQRTEIDKAVNLWADMVNPANQSDQSAKKREIDVLCGRVRQAK